MLFVPVPAQCTMFRVAKNTHWLCVDDDVSTDDTFSDIDGAGIALGKACYDSLLPALQDPVLYLRCETEVLIMVVQR